jgi:predicted nucleic acid-binding protein
MTGSVTSGVSGQVGPGERNGMAILIDSDVLIDHLRGKLQARKFLSASLDKELNICSVITQAEILAGMRAGEEGQVRALLSLFEFQPVTEAIAEEAGKYRREFGKSHGVELPDALIAGTALLRGVTLFTTNTKHYPMSDISVERPY